MVTDSQENMRKDWGQIQSTQGANLPTDEGLRFQVYDGQQWTEDASISIIEGRLPSPKFITFTGHTGVPPHLLVMSELTLEIT